MPKKRANQKAIQFILEPDDDMTHKPSLCFVKSGWQITFFSECYFVLDFNATGATPAPVAPVVKENKGIVKPSGQLGTFYILNTLVKTKNNLPIDPTGHTKKVYHYHVTLVDSSGNSHSDDYCPTIIIGDVRGEGNKPPRSP